MTTEAECLRKGGKVARETARITVRLRSRRSRKIFRIFGRGIDPVAHLAAGIADQAEMRGVIKGGESFRFRLRFHRPPANHRPRAVLVHGMAFHAKPRGLRIGQALESIARRQRTGTEDSAEMRARGKPGDKEGIGVPVGPVIESEALSGSIPATGGNPFFGRLYFHYWSGRRRGRCRSRGRRTTFEQVAARQVVVRCRGGAEQVGVISREQVALPTFRRRSRRSAREIVAPE